MMPDLKQAGGESRGQEDFLRVDRPWADVDIGLLSVSEESCRACLFAVDQYSLHSKTYHLDQSERAATFTTTGWLR